MVKNESFIVIQGWMVNNLGLKGNDLLVYAIIYGFTQDGKSVFSGSQSYLADWCNSTTRGIRKNLNDLVAQNLIIEVSKNVGETIEYKANLEILDLGTNFLPTSEQSSYDPRNKVPTPSEQSSDNNIDNKIDYKINNTKVLGIGKPIPDSSETEPMQSLTEFQMHGYSEEDLKREMKEHRTSVRRERVEDEKPKKKSLYVQCMEELDKRPNFTVEEKEALKLYLPVRLALKDKPLVGVNMWKGLLNSLDKMHGDRVRIVEYSTARGYAAFFEGSGNSKYYTKKGDVNGKVDPSVFGETEKHQQIAKKATLKDRQEVFASGVQF